MAFMVKKKINGKEYFYLNENKRIDGKVKTKTLAYLGKNKEESERKMKEILEKKDLINEKKENLNKSDKQYLIKQQNTIKEIFKNESEKDFFSFINESGLIWGPSPEIYGGVSGFYTYGPLGKLLKNKVENSVRNVFNSNGLREIEGPTVIPDIVWKASGHLDTFKDRIIKCLKCSSVFRADKIIEEKFDVSADSFSNDKILSFITERNIKCPSCNGNFENKIETQSLMMKTKVAGADFSLRPETATGTYLPFPRLNVYFRKKTPFGVFQIGKAYRNEISPRQNVLRGREFTQAEGQIFIDPLEKNSFSKYDEIKKEKLPFWDYKSQNENLETKNISIEDALKNGFIKSQSYGWCIWLAYTQFINFGIPPERIRLRQHHPDEKAFYADDAWDIEIKLNSFGWTECCGVHDRTDYDLKQHEKFSNVELKCSRENGEKFYPHILEIAFGTDRPTYALIDIFYDKKEINEGKTMFKIPYKMAPIEISIFPLIKKPELIKLSKEIKEELEKKFIVEYDESGSIGKRYLRSSIAGIPIAITIDFDSLINKDITIRDRNTEKQSRFKISELNEIINKIINGEVNFFNEK